MFFTRSGIFTHLCLQNVAAAGEASLCIFTLKVRFGKQKFYLKFRSWQQQYCGEKGFCLYFKIISEEFLITLMSLFMLCNLWSSKCTVSITYSIFIQQDNYFSDEEKEVQWDCDLTNHGVHIWMCLLISTFVLNCPYWAPSRWYHILKSGGKKVNNTNWMSSKFIQDIFLVFSK